MNRVLSFLFSLFPNIKAHAVPTRKELNNSPEGARWVFECEVCDDIHDHIKQKDNSWKCTNCQSSEINLKEEDSEELIRN